MEAEISHCWSSDVLQMFPARCTLLISSVGKQKCTRLNALIILLTNSNHLSGIVPTRTQTHALYVSGMGRIKSQKNHKSTIINQSTGFVPFFCKLGNKIWFLLVMCINWAYEAQWGHVWSSRRPLSVTVERAAQLTNQIWFDSKIHSVSTNSMESTVTSEPRVWVRGGELYHTLLLNYREWTEANQLKLKVNG